MKELIVLDIETTGVDFVHDDIIEIAAVKLKGSEIVDRFNTLVKPLQAKLGPTVAVLTGINPADLETAPRLDEVKDNLLAFCGELPIVGHNISFDVDFLKEKGINLPGPRLDTLELAYTLLPKLPFYSMEFLAYCYQFKNQPSHRAMNDVLATVELYDLLLSQVNQIPADQRQRINGLVEKASWDWSFIFTENIQAAKTYQPRDLPASALPDYTDQTLINPAELNAGLNVFELSPMVDQLTLNISLTKQLPKSILVVSPDVFAKTNWETLGLAQHFPSVYHLDPERFQFLLNKPTLEPRELKVLIKIILYGFSDGKFIPGRIYLTRRDEFYLFEQKLAPLSPRLSSLPDRAVTDFPGWLELAERGGIEPNRTVLIPQWIDLDEWHAERSAKWVTIAYFNAVVSSRRDFVHDLITDHKLADQLFKDLNELSSHLTMTAGLLGLAWQEQSKNGDVVEWEERFFTTKNGAALKDNLKGVIEALTRYRDAIKDAVTAFPEVLERQLTHTDDLTDHLSCVLDPGQAYKIYLDGRAGGFSLRIVKQAPENLWQTKLKDHSVVVASNGVTVAGNSGFISSVLGEARLIEVKSVSHGNENGKDVVWVRDLPNPKAINYQKLLFPYLRHQIEGEPGRAIVVLSTGRAVEDFFNESQPIVKSPNFLSFDVAGNEVVLGEKLSQWNQFAIVVSQYQAPYLLNVAPELDRVIYAKLAFDSPGQTAQLLAGERFTNGFTDYGLPRAVVAFKEELAKLYPKVKEVWMLDSRLITQDWGQPIRCSLGGWRHVDITAE
jgi:DNA polymerase III epsilon subunit family exonuclease